MDIGRVDIRVFLEPGEELLQERLVERLCELAGFDLERFRAEHPGTPIRTKRFELLVSTAEGFDGALRIVTTTILAKKDALACFDRVIKNLDEKDRSFLLETLPSRVDDQAHCFVRLDKTRFLKGGFELVDHGRCVHLDFNVLTYPSSREASIAFLEARIRTGAA